MISFDISWVRWYENQIKLHESIPDEDYDDYVIDGLTKQEFLQLCREQILIIKLTTETKKEIV